MHVWIKIAVSDVVLHYFALKFETVTVLKEETEVLKDLLVHS